MKKTLIILLLGLLFCNTSFAELYFFNECKNSNAVTGNYTINIEKSVIEVTLKTVDGKIQNFTDKIKKLLLTGNLWAAYPAAVSKSFKKTYKIFHERKQRYAGNTKMNLYKLFIHSLRVFSVFKYKIFTFSLLYSLILTVLVPNFYFFIFLLAIGNFLIFLDSYNNKKKYEDSFNSIIGKIDIIK